MYFDDSTGSCEKCPESAPRFAMLFGTLVAIGAPLWFCVAVVVTPRKKVNKRLLSLWSRLRHFVRSFRYAYVNTGLQAKLKIFFSFYQVKLSPVRLSPSSHRMRRSPLSHSRARRCPRH